MPRSRAAASRPLPSAEHWGALLVIAPLAVAALRQAGEVILGVGWPDGPVLQNDLVFYLATELAMLWLLRLTTGSPMQELAPFVALGLLLGVLPRSWMACCSGRQASTMCTSTPSAGSSGPGSSRWERPSASGSRWWRPAPSPGG